MYINVESEPPTIVVNHGEYLNVGLHNIVDINKSQVNEPIKLVSFEPIKLFFY